MAEIAVNTSEGQAPVTDAAGEVAHAEARVAEAEANADAAVQIAETQAAAEVEQARIRAETEQAAIDAAAVAATAVTRQELEQCQANTLNLTTELQEVKSGMQLILSRLDKLEPPPSQQEEPVNNAQMPEHQEAPAEPARPKRSGVGWT
jgi:hypothetical protein